jgi:hypothetical protein
MWEWIKFHPEIAIIGAVTLIQIAPIKLDPWTMLAKWFRRVASGEIEQRLSSIEKKIDRVENTIEEREAVLARTHILRFNDELHNGLHHSSEYFLQTIDDIAKYDQYCAAHPNFANGRTVIACEQIRETYKRLYEEHKI